MILRLVSESDTLDLNEVAETGVGYQALAGITGLGLPDVSVQWAEGAGDGAVYHAKNPKYRSKGKTYDPAIGPAGFKALQKQAGAR